MTETSTHPSSSYKSPLILSIVTPFDAKLKRNYYFTQVFQGFTWMLFHFSVVFFFGLLLENILLVGIFLGFANLISLFLDVPIGLIQRYVSTKRLFLIAGITQFIAVGVFFFLIFRFSVLLEYVGGVVTPESFSSGIEWFFGSFLNWVGVFIAAVCYGVTQEINAVAGYGYVLSHANPSEYSAVFSRSHIAWGIGSVAGLLLSGIVLQTPSWLAVIVLALVILGLNAFTYQFFNTTHEVIDIKDITAFKASIQHLTMENVKEYLVSTVKKADLGTVVQTAGRYIFLRPQKKELDTPIPWSTLISETKKEIRVTLHILFQQPFHVSLFWAIGMLLIFGFWDTFATSFLVDFLDSVKHGWSFILLTLIVIPGVLLQTYAGSIANRIGMTYVGAFGLALSGFSLVALGIFSFFSLSPLIILILAVLNSIGYAAGMPMGQNHFLEKYNILYAEHLNLKEIDANASAGPIRMIGNFANVVGLMLGGFILELFHYTGFFLIFGLIILAFLVWVVMRQDHINAN